MRKVIVFGVILLCSVLLIRVYATTPSSSAPTWIVRLTAANGLVPGDAVVNEVDHQIGQVIEVAPHTASDGEGGMDVHITLDPSAQDQLRERATFFVTKPPGATRPVLRLVVFDAASPVLPPGSRIAGAESELEVELKRQIASLDGAVRSLSQQLDQFRIILDKTSKSEEKRKLEEGVEGFLTNLQQTRNDILRVVTEEIARWKRLYDKVFPPEHEDPTSFTS